jgi:hypothetical protein
VKLRRVRFAFVSAMVDIVFPFRTMSTKAIMKWPAVSSARRGAVRFDGRDLDGLSHSTIRGQCRMKGSVGDPHSDQRGHLSRREVSDDLVRGHRLWTAVKARGRHGTITAALASSTPRRVCPRVESYVVPGFHNAYSRCASFRASAMIATCMPRRAAAWPTAPSGRGSDGGTLTTPPAPAPSAFGAPQRE